MYLLFNVRLVSSELVSVLYAHKQAQYCDIIILQVVCSNIVAQNECLLLVGHYFSALYVSINNELPL